MAAIRNVRAMGKNLLFDTGGQATMPRAINVYGDNATNCRGNRDDP
jgi:hypothetical protein